LALTTLFTTGVYGQTEGSFLRGLTDNRIDLLADIRDRRGVRGGHYPFANAGRLQELLAANGIGYVHWREVAPPADMRAIQGKADHQARQKKSDRERLDPAFIKAYEAFIATKREWLKATLANESLSGKRICLVCVERTPDACHRSLLAKEIQAITGCAVEHIINKCK